jgi:signal recognition particle GTPase
VLGGQARRIQLAKTPPTVILLAGLQGSGKTTGAPKLALLLRKEGKTPALVAADLQRPAAIDQLEQLGKQIQIPVYLDRSSKDPVAVARYGLEQARAQGRDVLIVDTAGRLHTRQPLMDELAKVRRVLDKAAGDVEEVLLVVDATTGQNGLQQARVFTDAVNVTGVALTKLDGTAKGGIVLAVREELGVPVKFIGTGERIEDLQPFDPTAFAERLLAA